MKSILKRIHLYIRLWRNILNNVPITLNTPRYLLNFAWNVVLIKICYDKAGNLPNKGRNFNTQTWGKIVYFLFVWLVGIGFRQNFFRVLPNFGDFGAKMSFFHYIINQNRNNFIKHCSPPCTKKPLISEMGIYIKSSLCKWGLGTRGGTMFYRQKTKGVSA